MDENNKNSITDIAIIIKINKTLNSPLSLFIYDFGEKIYTLHLTIRYLEELNELEPNKLKINNIKKIIVNDINIIKYKPFCKFINKLLYVNIENIEYVQCLKRQVNLFYDRSIIINKKRVHSPATEDDYPHFSKLINKWIHWTDI